MAEDEALMDLEMMDLEEEPMMDELPEEEEMMVEEEEGMGMLEEISDDELIAEIQKRGIEVPEMDMAEEEDMPEDEEEEEMV